MAAKLVDLNVKIPAELRRAIREKSKLSGVRMRALITTALYQFFVPEKETEKEQKINEN